MEKLHLLAALEGWQSKDPHKNKINHITHAVLENTEKSPLLEAIIKKPLGFPVTEYNDELINADKDDLENIKDRLGITEPQVKQMVEAKSTGWNLAERKTIYVKEEDFKNPKDSLSILDKKTHKVINFSQPLLITGAYDKTTKGKIIEAGGVGGERYIEVSNVKLRETAVYKLDNDTYIMGFQLKGNPAVYLFPIKPESFNAAFDIKESDIKESDIKQTKQDAGEVKVNLPTFTGSLDIYKELSEGNIETLKTLDQFLNFKYKDDVDKKIEALKDRRFRKQFTNFIKYEKTHRKPRPKPKPKPKPTGTEPSKENTEDASKLRNKLIFEHPDNIYESPDIEKANDKYEEITGGRRDVAEVLEFMLNKVAGNSYSEEEMKKKGELLFNTEFLKKFNDVFERVLRIDDLGGLDAEPNTSEPETGEPEPDAAPEADKGNPAMLNIKSPPPEKPSGTENAKSEKPKKGAT